MNEDFIWTGILIVWCVIIATDCILNAHVKKLYREYNGLLTEQNEMLKRIIMDFGAKKEE